MGIDERGIISTDKHWLNRPETAWSNTYEFTAYTNGSVSPAQAAEILAALVLAERFMHLDVVQYTGARMARYVPKTVYPVPDSEEPPYDPTNTIPYITNATGSRTIPGFDGVEPKDTILWISRSGGYGRVGTWEGRGCLLDSELQDTDGDYTLVNRAAFETRLETFAASLVAIEQTYDIKFSLMGEPQISATYIMVGAKKIKTAATYGATYEIPISDWSVRGARADRAKKKWYNRQ